MHILYVLSPCEFRIRPEEGGRQSAQARCFVRGGEPALYDPMALTREDADSPAERRFLTVGTGALGRVLLVCWTERGQTVRVISARLATAHERKCYES